MCPVPTVPGPDRCRSRCARPQSFSHRCCPVLVGTDGDNRSDRSARYGVVSDRTARPPPGVAGTGDVRVGGTPYAGDQQPACRESRPGTGEHLATRAAVVRLGPVLQVQRVSHPPEQGIAAPVWRLCRRILRVELNARHVLLPRDRPSSRRTGRRDAEREWVRGAAAPGEPTVATVNCRRSPCAATPRALRAGPGTGPLLTPIPAPG